MRNFEGNSILTRAIDRIFDKEKRKERRRRERLERQRKEIRKIARRVNDPGLYNL